MIYKPIRIEIIHDVGRFLSLKPHWDYLCDKLDDYNFSQSFEWCATAWNIIYKPQRSQLYCLVGWADDKVVLIWPFVVHRRALWLIARPLGSVTSEYCDVLVEDSPEADRWVALAWQALRTTCQSDVIILPFVRAGSRLDRIVARERHMFANVFPISSVSLDGYPEWGSYYRSLRNGFRYSLRSRRVRLAERGNLIFEAVTTHEQYPLIIDWLLLHKAEWLNRTNQSSPWQDTEKYKQFLGVVAAEKEGIGHLMLFVLKLDGRIISAVLSRISKFSVEAVIAAFDRAYSKYSPGQLLYEDILKWAFERRLELDFRIGDDPYKKSWTNRKSEATIYRFVNSIWGAAFILVSLCRSKLQSFRRHGFAKKLFF